MMHAGINREPIMETRLIYIIHRIDGTEKVNFPLPVHGILPSVSAEELRLDTNIIKHEMSP